MTPQERQRVAELFDRLAMLEQERRDPDAERAIADALRRAPNAIYPLVQTVLVQDEVLKRADARIQELEARLDEAPQREGFLDTMRGALSGRDRETRGSVPSVRSGPVWNGAQSAPASPPSVAPEQAGRGGSFLGTAAAAAAGVIGGSLLFGGLRSMMGGNSASAAPQQAVGGETREPWGNDASGSDIARDAGLGDIGSTRTAGRDDGHKAGLFDNQDFADADDDGDADFGGDDFGDSAA